MAGSPSYTDDEIRFVLDCVLRKMKHDDTASAFFERFGKHLRANQIRYLKNKYGRSHHFGSPLINFKGNRDAFVSQIKSQDRRHRNSTQVARQLPVVGDAQVTMQQPIQVNGEQHDQQHGQVDEQPPTEANEQQQVDGHNHNQQTSEQMTPANNVNFDQNLDHIPLAQNQANNGNANYPYYDPLAVHPASPIAQAVDGPPAVPTRVPLRNGEDSSVPAYTIVPPNPSRRDGQSRTNTQTVWFNGVPYSPGHPLYTQAITAAAVVSRGYMHNNLQNNFPYAGTYMSQDLTYGQFSTQNGTSGQEINGQAFPAPREAFYPYPQGGAVDTPSVAPADLQNMTSPTYGQATASQRRSSPEDFLQQLDQAANRPMFHDRGLPTTEEAQGAEAVAPSPISFGINPTMVERFHAQAERLAVDLPAYMESNATGPPPYVNGTYDPAPRYDPQGVPAGGGNLLIRSESPYPLEEGVFTNGMDRPFYPSAPYMDAVADAQHETNGINAWSPSVVYD